ncbi:hypothetical protein [uncultured Tateyamaria sp.]|uniref:hypothetical protein n=1 Tax=uncultured Tateyamaria sp. TaxID=455651 RepID=UPI00261C044A|nr:hypothetical protein [uncultured Tateyamaria sp.]
MTVQLPAQPYDLAATGFYFDSYDGDAEKSVKLRNDYDDPVEEFEIQFIDCDLAKALGIIQANLKQYLDVVEDWDEDDKPVSF